jgi:type II secretory ATPase GspE/PulE/Tfp pilus assembly ATPase PilB-like protein
LRLNIMPVMHGESLAMRLLIRDAALQRLDRLGMTRPQLGEVFSASLL